MTTLHEYRTDSATARRKAAPLDLKLQRRSLERETHFSDEVPPQVGFCTSGTVWPRIHENMQRLSNTRVGSETPGPAGRSPVTLGLFQNGPSPFSGLDPSPSRLSQRRMFAAPLPWTGSAAGAASCAAAEGPVKTGKEEK